MSTRGVSGAVALALCLCWAGEAVAQDALARAAALRERGEYAAAIRVLERSLPNARAELMLAETLAFAKRFDEAETRYRAILARSPESSAARLGLARVLLWQGRYREAIAAFDEILERDPQLLDAREGRATAAYWSGDLRTAAREFRRVLASDPRRELARTSLAEISALAAASQRLRIESSRDDQPLDAVRGELSGDFFSDPLTRWSVALGGYHADAGRIGSGSGGLIAIENETVLPGAGLVIGGRLGLFEFPDGERLPIGSIRVRRRELSLIIERREELATATALRTHANSLGATLRWNRESEDSWIAAAEISTRRYYDENSGYALIGYAVRPLLGRDRWTVWGGASGALRHTQESRFRLTAISSTFDPSGGFQYQYRGLYDPYWTPRKQAEARLVAAVERRFARGSIKLHADGGVARDEAEAFGPDRGSTSLPPATFSFSFDRRFTPWRAGATAAFEIAPRLRLEAGAERSVTVDYESTTFHAAVVRRH